MKKSPEKTALRNLAGGLATIVLPIFATAGAQAQQVPSDETILVVARIDNPAQGSPSGIRSLNRVDLPAQAPISLLENFALLPGIDAFEKGGPGGGSYLSVRGGEPNFALVVINGVRVNDPLLSTGGSFDFSLIGPTDAERIDVLTGPWSTAYGADALSGVVSIRLDAPQDRNGAAANVGVGSGGRYEIGGRAFLSGRAGSLVVAGSARDSGSLYAGAANQGQSAMVSAAPELGENASLDVFGYYGASQSSGFPEDSGGPELAVIRTRETRDRGQIALGATFRTDITASMLAQVRAGWSRSTFASNSPGIAPGVIDGIPPVITDSRFDRFEAVANLDWSPQRNVSLGLGASYVREDGRSDGVVDFGFPIPTAFSLSRTLPGLFATAAIVLPDSLELRGGVRVDFPDNGKARVTPRAGLAVPFGNSGFRLTANYAQGFKQPSLFALGYPLIANPDLLPERSRAVDAGLEWTSPDDAWQASATLYRSVYRDLIDFDPDLFTNVNRNRVTAQGLEVAASGKAGAFHMIGSLTYLDTKSADGAQLRFRPEWKAAAALEWVATETLTFRLDGKHSASFFDSSVPTGLVRLHSFTTFDAQAALALGSNVVLRAAVRNLAAERYGHTVGTPEPGRSVFVSLHGTL